MVPQQWQEEPGDGIQGLDPWDCSAAVLRQCSDLCNNVKEMQKLDAQVKELVLKSVREGKQLVAGKLKKEKFISEKRQELVTNISHILDAL